VTYEGNFVVITDEYYRRTAIPSDLVQEVIEVPERF